MDQSALRTQLVKLLRGGDAHLDAEAVFDDVPFALWGRRPDKAPHTLWQLLEHLRIAQWDILDFSRNPDYVLPAFPEDYWPKSDGPADRRALATSLQAFRADLEAMQALVENPATDLFARIPWGEGQTILREALVLADHNAYHLGQCVLVRRLLDHPPAA